MGDPVHVPFLYELSSSLGARLSWSGLPLHSALELFHFMWWNISWTQVNHLLGRCLRQCTTVFTHFLGENSAILLTGSSCLSSSRGGVQYCLAECPALPWVIPLHPLNDYGLLREFQSVALKRQQTTGMYFVTLVFLPIMARGCLAMSWGASLPGW